MAEKITLLELDIKTDEVVKDIQELTEKLKVLKQAQADALQTSGPLSESYIKATADLKNTQSELNTTTKVYQKLTAAQGDNAGTIQKLEAENAKLRLEQKSLNTTTEEGAKRNEEIKAKIDANVESVKKLSDSQSRGKMQVGLYSEGIQDAAKKTNNFGKSTLDAAANTSIFGLSAKGAVGQVKSVFSGIESGAKTGVNAFKTLRGALMASGIGAIVIAIISLVSYFTKSDEGAKTLKATMAALGAILDTVVGVVVKYGKVWKDIFTLNFKGVVQDFKDIGDQVKNTGKNMKEAYDIEQQEFKLKKAKREAIIEEAKLTRDISKLRLEASDKTKTNQERIEALKKSLEGEKLLTQEKMEIAKSELLIMEKRFELAKTQNKKMSGDDKERLAQLKANIYLIEQEEYDRSKRAVSKLSQFQVELEEQAIKAQEDANKRRIANAQGFLEAKVLMSQKGSKEELDNQIKLLEFLKKTELSNKELTEGEKAKIRAKYTKDEEKVNEEFTKKQIEEAKKVANEQLALLQIEIDNYKLKNKSKLDANYKMTAEMELAEEYRLKAINKKEQQYLDEQIKANPEKIGELNNAKLAKQQEYEENVKTLRENYRASELERLQIDFENQQAAVEDNLFKQFEAEKAALDRNRQLEIQAAQKTGADVKLINAKYNQAEVQMEKAKQAAKLALLSNFAGNVAALFGENTKLGKIAASAQTAVNTIQGAQSAYAAAQILPPPAGPIVGAANAALVIAGGVKAVKDIWATKTNLPGDTGGGGDTSIQATTGGSSSTAVTTQAVTGSVNPEIGQGIVSRTVTDTTSQIASGVEQGMNAATTRPVLVVEEVTSKQLTKQGNSATQNL